MTAYNTNVVQNPGAEENDGQTLVPKWTTTGAFQEVQYGTNATASPGSGNQLFEGGTGDLSRAFQDISIEDLSININNNTVSATLSGQLGGYQDQNDYVTLTVTWYGSGGTNLGTLTAPTIMAADRANQSVLLPVSINGQVPSGTVSARVMMTATRISGTFNNGYADNVSLVLQQVPCFATGTLIRTVRGEVAVEDLIVGDFAVTDSGRLRPIIWIGNRALDAHGARLPYDHQPVRIRAGAFGKGLPTRDLRLSQGHPILVGIDANGEGGHLVPIMCLINGTTITREAVASVTYWHVELDSHDILIAEGLPAESYLDWGDRPFFDDASNHALQNPDFIVPGLAARCRPVALDGLVVEAERVRLAGVFAGCLDADCAWEEAMQFRWIAV